MPVHQSSKVIAWSSTTNATATLSKESKLPPGLRSKYMQVDPGGASFSSHMSGTFGLHETSVS